MSIKVVSDKLKELGNEIEKNSDSYDVGKLSIELKDFESKVFLCRKPDKELMNILANKKCFKTRPQLDTFVESLIKTCSKIKSRTEAEIENTLLLMKNKISIEEMKSKLPKENESPKKKTTKAPKKPKFPLEEWIKTDESTLKEELLNYSLTELRTTGSMYLKASDKTIRSKEKVIEAIIKGIKELKSISRLGT